MNPSREQLINLQKMADPATETTDPNTGKKVIIYELPKEFLAKDKISSGFPAYRHTPMR